MIEKEISACHNIDSNSSGRSAWIVSDVLIWSDSDDLLSCVTSSTTMNDFVRISCASRVGDMLTRLTSIDTLEVEGTMR